MLKFEECSPKAALTPIPPYISPPLFFTPLWYFMIQNQDKSKTKAKQKKTKTFILYTKNVEFETIKRQNSDNSNRKGP